MRSLKYVVLLSAILILLAIVAGFSAAQPYPVDSSILHEADARNGSPTAIRTSDIVRRAELNSSATSLLPSTNGQHFLKINRLPTNQVARQEAILCSNRVSNNALNVVEFGDGSGQAEPWSILFDTVYFTKDPATAFDGYSLFLQDMDAGDSSPGIDAFGQGMLMPEELDEIVIDYQRATVDTNATDIARGELWLLNDDGFLDLNDPDQYFVANWEIEDSDLRWAHEIIGSTNPSILDAIAGKWIALIFYNVTDNAPLAEAIYFDEIYFTACFEGELPPSEAYVPLLLGGIVGDPVCVPPSEQPPDQFHSHRGLVQTGATCNSSLSNVDRADYFTFQPTSSGKHLLKLSNLPAGSEWSAMAFNDDDSPDYAPGATSGQCRIAIPGNVDKQVECTFEAGKNYFAKVSAGSTPLAGEYRFQIVKAAAGQ